MKLIRKIALTTALVAVSLATTARAQIAAWDFTGEDAVVTSAAEVFTNLDSSNLLTRGAGAAASVGANSFRTTGFSNNGIAVTNTDYFQFTLSATTGFSLSLSSIDIRTTGTSTYVASPGVSQQFAYSTDGVSFTLIGSPTITIGTNQTANINLTSVSALQNVADSTTLTFRYYASGQTTTGGYGFFSNIVGNYGLAVNGATQAIPEPSVYMLLGVGLLFCAQRFLRGKRA